MRGYVVLAVGSALLACGSPIAEAPLSGAEIASAELTGVDGSHDSADTRCNVVLRSMNRRDNGTGGYLTDESGRWRWFAEIDVSEAATGEDDVPALLFQVGSDPNWYSAPAVRVNDAPGFTRWVASPGMIGEGISGTSLTRVHIRAIPYLTLSGGGRLFDHNRIGDPGAAYDLSWSDGHLAISEDAAICPPPTPPGGLDRAGTATLSLALDGTITQDGALLAGTRVRVNYDIERLPNCRGTHNGFPAWNVIAYARFLPSGEVVQGDVRAFRTQSGVPTNQGYSVPFHFTVPAGSTRFELWFQNFTGAGSSCQAWDSQNGHNYGFDLLPAVGWIGEASTVFSRATGGCDGGAPTGAGFNYDTWVRQRAAARNLCFQVWQAGVTDRDNPNLWRQIDVEAHYRFSPNAPFRTAFVSYLDRIGNNARYRFDVGAFDPFRWGAPCEGIQTTPSADGQYDEAHMELYFTANGVFLGAGPDQPYAGVFQDYRGSLAGRCP
ncbi:MAG: DUF6209 family protein [Myxococcota bacterium]